MQIRKESVEFCSDVWHFPISLFQNGTNKNNRLVVVNRSEVYFKVTSCLKVTQPVLR